MIENTNGPDIGDAQNEYFCEQRSKRNMHCTNCGTIKEVGKPCTSCGKKRVKPPIGSYFTHKQGDTLWRVVEGLSGMFVERCEELRNAANLAPERRKQLIDEAIVLGEACLSHLMSQSDNQSKS